MTDNEKTVLEKLYDELRAELSTAQLNCDMWHDRAEDMRNRLSAAQAENAKLRKLVKRMHDHIKESCDICDEDYCSSWDEDNECCVYDTMLREVLGVVRP